MIQLTKHSLTPTGSFLVETMGMTLAEKDSSITFTVALPGRRESSAPLPEAPDLTIGDWLMEDEAPGEGLVWRVKSIDDDYTKRVRTVTAEHIIQVLKDTAMFGEVTPEDMGGSSTSCTALQAVSYAMNQQSDWVLGGLGYEQSAGYTFNGDSVLEAVTTVCGTLEDCWWSYDLSVYPFRLYINPKSATAGCEMRMSRNITTIKRTVDASQLYTRIYPIGKDDLHITGNYLSRNENVYGVIQKVETNQSIATEAALTTWAQLRLKKHSEPNVTVSISGLELSWATGEPLDNLFPGKMCQVPLPEYGTVILATLMKLVWKDKKKEPQAVTVTLANTAVDLATIIRENNESNTGGSGAGGRRSGSAGKKKQEEDHAWMVDTTDHVGLVAEAVAGEGADQDWSRVAEVMVDGEGVHQRVTRTEGDLVVAENRIDVLEDGIVLKVSKGDVSTQLAIECGNVSITGGNLTVDGYVTAAGLDAEISNLQVVHVKSIQAAQGTANANISLHSVTAQNTLYVGSGQNSVELISSGITDAVTDLQLVPVSGTATCKLQKKTIASHSSWTDVGTFSKAAALSGAYGGDNTGDTATYTVTGTPAENFPGGNSLAGSFQVKQNKNAAWVEDSNGTIRARINNPQYGNGWAAAYGDVSLPTASSTAGSFTIETPSSTVDGAAVTTTYTMNDAMKNVATVTNPSGTVVARLQHNRYDEGVDDCWATVGIAEIYNTPTLPSGQSVAGQFIPGRYYRISPQSIKSDGEFHVNGVGWYYAPDTSSAAYEQGKTDGYNLYHNSIHHLYVVGSPHVEVASGLQFWTVSIRDAGGAVLKVLNGNYDGDNSTGLIAVGRNLTYTPGSSQQVDTINNFVNTVTVNAATHSPTASVMTQWTGSIAGRTSLGSVSASSLARTYLLVDAKCGGVTKGYYLTIN